MKLFSVKQIAEIDSFTIKNEPVSSIDLMERASYKIFEWITKNTIFSSFTIFAGFGNNGGDGLAVARMLLKNGFKVNVYYLESEKYSPDFLINLKRLKGLCKPVMLTKKIRLVFNDCIFDALFGSGLTRPVAGAAAEVIRKINNSGKPVVAVDIPSGLMGEYNSENNSGAIIKATNTVSLQFPKLSFFFSENNEFTGDWCVVPIGLHKDAISRTSTKWHLTTEDDIATMLKARSRFANKGSYGHALIYAGSCGKFGAGILAARACIHSGAGLTTIHTTGDGAGIFQSAVPEAMGDYSERMVSLEKYNAIAAGPGIGTSQDAVARLKGLLTKAKVPLVLDADALNLIASDNKLLKILPPETIITPHPREFSRLAGESRNSYEMLDKAVKYAIKNKLIVVLKGAFTRIILPDGSVYFNPTGNPGMAKGGSGDVLTGIIVSLMARGYCAEDAAKLGVYLHGLAGDIAARELTPEYVSAGDIISYLCHAFKKVYSL